MKEEKEITITVRGYTFKAFGNLGYIPLKELTSLYMVLKAIEGDPLAREILDATGKIINDADGNQIYPPT